jgi:hypothetical protein
VTGYSPAGQAIRDARGLPYATGADDPPAWHDQPAAQPETRPAP